PAGENSTYFLYYNDEEAGLTGYDYGTDFTNSYISDTNLTVIKDSTDFSSNFLIKMYQGTGVNTLRNVETENGQPNYHSTYSLAPEIIIPAYSLTPEDSNFTIILEGDDEELDADYDGVGSLGYIDGYTDGSEWVEGIAGDALNLSRAENQYAYFGDLLEGSGEFFERNAKNYQPTFTLTAWINPTELYSTPTSFGTQNVIFAKADETNGAIFEMGINDQKIFMYIDGGNKQRSGTFGSGNIISTGSWTFIALEVDIGNKIYKLRYNDDTDFVTSSGAFGDIGKLVEYSDPSNLTIGASLSGGPLASFDGAIDEVRMFDRLLSLSELDTIYNSTVPASLVTHDIDSIIKDPDITLGPVFSKFEVEWTNTFDMIVSDICTFYWDYNMWSIERSISFGHHYIDNDTLIPMNTYYSFTPNPDTSHYIYDGIAIDDLTNTAGIEWNDYLIVHATGAPVNKHAFGIFMQNYTMSNPNMVMNYFNGTVVYNAGTSTEIRAGINNDFDSFDDGHEYRLDIKFWEFIDVVDITSASALETHFDQINEKLHVPLNYYFYNKASLNYSVEVYVGDRDGSPVEGAIVYLWNSTNPDINWSATTDETGYAQFEDVLSGTNYEVRPLYELNGVMTEITSSQFITDLVGGVNPQGVYSLTFDPVNMTSIALHLTKDGADMYNAEITNISYYYDSGSQAISLGNVNANSSGIAVLHWRNATINGNISFSVRWAGEDHANLACADDLDLTDDARVVLSFTDFAVIDVNSTDPAIVYVNYTTRINPVPDVFCQLRESFMIELNFSYYENETIYQGGLNGTVSMDLELEGASVNTNPLVFSDLGYGIYRLNISTSDEIEPGVSWTEGTYGALITGVSPSYGSDSEIVNIRISPLNTRLTTNTSTIEVFWNEYFDIYVHYEYNNSGVWTGITGADVYFKGINYGLGDQELTGLNSGWYVITLRSSDFPNIDTWSLNVDADKQDYEAQSLQDYVPTREINLTINAINTKLNESTSVLSESFNIYLGEEEVIYFNYRTVLTDLGISGATIAYSKVRNDFTGYERTVYLNDIGNGLYSLDIGTEDMEVGSYSVIVYIQKPFYQIMFAFISIDINLRDFDTTLAKIYSVVSGNSLTINVYLYDELSGDPITDIVPGDMNVTFLGRTYDFTLVEPEGYYTVTITNIPSEVFFTSETISASVSIRRENYTITTEDITVEVKMMEIWPGMPLFYFLMIIVAISLSASSVVAYTHFRQEIEGIDKNDFV
ncbi:MAG: LamG-like jellyroll fold domain-containing protein, partial [Promethearchaeota archaeon]